MIMTTALLFALGTAIVFGGQDAQAAKKKKVRATVKGSTLTISGRGAMPSSLKIKKSKRNKVKKIVIKKGITSIPVNAFTKYKNVTSATVAASVKTIGQDAFSCKKLKKLTVPGKFKIKTPKDMEWPHFFISQKVDTVTFNTNLDLDRAAAFDAGNLVVKKSDPKYKSIKGVIYSKDGKAIVRVPFQRKEIAITEGCEVFCLQSVMYANNNLEGPGGGCRVKKIVIPASVTKVESQRYKTGNNSLSEWNPGYGHSLKGLRAEVISKKLNGQSFSELVHVLKLDVDDLMKEVPDQISCKDNMYITSDHLLLKYTGKDKNVKVPEGITKIGDYAFYDILNQTRISKLELPEGLVEIGKMSFSGCSGYYSFDSNEICNMEVTFPSTLKKIGDNAFFSNIIRRLVVPASVENWGKEVFHGAGVEELILPDTMKVVPEGLAMGNGLKKVVIPDSVQKIEKKAFAYNKLEEIQFGKNLTEIGDNAFYSAPKTLKKLTIPASITKMGEGAFGIIESILDTDPCCDIVIQGSSSGISDRAFGRECVLDFTKKPEEKKASVFFGLNSLLSNGLEVELKWTKVKDVDGYELMVSTNSKFTKNKKKVSVNGNCTSKTIKIKGKFKENVKIYARIRPYTKVNGKKVYGRLSKVVS